MTDAPSHVRHATRGDLPEVVDLLIACDVAEVGEPDTTTEDVEADWNAAGFNLAADAWVAEGHAGAITGYAYAGDQRHTGELEGDLWVHPAADEPGLPGRLLGLVERRAREIAAAAAYGDAALDVFSLIGNRAKRELLLQHDFAPRRTIHRLRLDLPEKPEAAAVPPGIDLRPFRQGVDEHAMRDALNEAFEDDFRAATNEPFEAWRTRLLGHPDFDPALWFLGWDGDEPVGGVVAYDYHDMGWVKGLGVRRPYRRRGLGKALLTAAFAALAEGGQRRVELGVDAEGETRPLHLYESLGMRVVHAYELFEKSLAPRSGSTPGRIS